MRGWGVSSSEGVDEGQKEPVKDFKNQIQVSQICILEVCFLKNVEVGIEGSWGKQANHLGVSWGSSDKNWYEPPQKVIVVEMKKSGEIQVILDNKYCQV